MRPSPSRTAIPGTFSINTNPGWTSPMMRAVSGQRSRSSSVPARFPATDHGGHGIPPMTPSTIPRHGLPSKVRKSVQTGASSRASSSMRAARTSQQYASCSTQQTVTAEGHASLTPRSSPPPPEQRLRMLSLPSCIVVIPVATPTHPPVILRIVEVACQVCPFVSFGGIRCPAYLALLRLPLQCLHPKMLGLVARALFPFHQQFSRPP